MNNVMNNVKARSWSGHVAHTVFPTLLVPALLVLAGCASQPDRPGNGFSTPELAGTRWVITRIDGKEPVRGPALTADFSNDGRISGDAGCNSYSGPFIQTGTTVQFGELLSTRRACVDVDRQRQETKVLEILKGSSTIRLNRSQLSVRSSQGSVVLTQSEPVALSFQR